MESKAGRIVSVSRSGTHTFTKERVSEIVLLAGLGVEGDAHAGAKVKHRYLVKRNPDAPNLAQVHLLQAELFAQLASGGLAIAPGEMGENVTTKDVDLLALPLGTRLHLGESAVVQVTGLRTPCNQMDQFRPGLKQACLARDEQGGVLRKSGIMSVVVAGGRVRPEDAIRVEYPAGEWVKLKPV